MRGERKDNFIIISKFANAARQACDGPFFLQRYRKSLFRKVVLQHATCVISHHTSQWVMIISRPEMKSVVVLRGFYVKLYPPTSIITTEEHCKISCT